MRLALFFKLFALSIAAALLWFALWPGSTVVEGLKVFAFGTAMSMGAAAFYPEIRGIRAGDAVSVVSHPSVPSLIGKMGVAAEAARRNGQVKITLHNGTEVTGVVESYIGLVSPPKVRAVYEERMI